VAVDDDFVACFFGGLAALLPDPGDVVVFGWVSGGTTPDGRIGGTTVDGDWPPLLGAPPCLPAEPPLVPV
jgi:hypothetical protein